MAGEEGPLNQDILPPICLVTIFSFGHIYGQPQESSRNWDARKFPNVSRECRGKYTGLDKKLRHELFMNEDAERFYQKVLGEIFAWIEVWKEERQDSEVAIGVGCHHGKHRSVSIVERLCVDLPGLMEIQVVPYHRDVNREKEKKRKQK